MTSLRRRRMRRREAARWLAYWLVAAVMMGLVAVLPGAWALLPLLIGLVALVVVAAV